MTDQPSLCATASAAVEWALRAQSATAIPADVLAHLSSCPRCRAGLLLTLRALAEKAGPPADTSLCADCQIELAAFVEQERANPAYAAEHYPAVWSHLWTCRSCAEEYVTVHALLDAEQDSALPQLLAPEPVLRQSVPHSFQHILLTRGMLTAMLPPRSAAWATYRGSQQQGFVLFDASDAKPMRQVTIVVREEDRDLWCLTVTTVPPVRGVLLLTAGVKSFTASFTAEGIATILNIPTQLLTHPDAPDLEIALQPSA
jgi:hypothetical protein